MTSILPFELHAPMYLDMHYYVFMLLLLQCSIIALGVGDAGGRSCDGDDISDQELAMYQSVAVNVFYSIQGRLCFTREVNKLYVIMGFNYGN